MQSVERDAEQILVTAVAVPHTDGRHVERARLVRRLDDAAEYRVVYVRAPAGFGKTSMLAEWTHRRSGARRIAWLSLSEAHADARSLLRYIIAALRSRCGPVGEATLTLLNANVPISAASLITTLVNELAALDEDAWLVLDDLHCVAHREAADCVAELVRKGPVRLHFVLASREAPPFPVGRLRQLGDLDEIDTRDLEFTAGEVEALLQREALPLTRSEAERLATNTGGWAAGLRLAAISMRGQASPALFLDSFSGGHTAIAEFLQEDVMNRQSVELQQFLTESALLDELTAPLCDFALERDGSAALLRAAHERGLFLSSTAQDGSRFRYHRMFSDHLRQRIMRDDGARAAAICARASEWYSQHGADYEAIDYALRAGDGHRAAKLLEDASERLFSSGRLEVLRAFAARLPHDLLDECPRLLLDLIWIHTLSWEPGAAESLMKRMQCYAVRHGDRLPPALAEKVLHREIMMSLLQDKLAEAEALWERWPVVSTGENEYFDGSAETAALLVRRERFECRFVIAQAPRVRRRFVEAGAEYGTVWFDSVVGPALLMCGESERAAQTLRSAVNTAERTSGTDSPLVAMPALLLGEVLYERGELDASRAIVESLLPRGDRIGFVDQLIAGYVCAIRLAAVGEGEPHAFRLLTRGEALAREHDFERLGVHLAAERVRLLLASGRTREARGYLQSDPMLQRGSLLPGRLASVSDAVIAVAHARVAHGTAAAVEMLKVLRTWVNYVEGHGCVRQSIALRGVLATLLHAHDEPAEAWRVLRVAIEQSRASGIVQPLTEDGTRMLRVLDFAASNNSHLGGGVAETVDGLRRYLAGQSATAVSLITPRREPPGTIQPDPLTERQREILTCIADGSSNKEVAARLGVAEATVKWHLRLVYDKLGVHRRVAAVREARALGVIP